MSTPVNTAAGATPLNSTAAAMPPARAAAAPPAPATPATPATPAPAAAPKTERRAAARQVTGLYFDGAESRPHRVTLFLSGAQARIVGAAVDKRFRTRALLPETRMEHAPRQITLPDGSECEFADGKALDALLNSAGFRASRLLRWEQQWEYSLGALAAIVLLFIAGYQWGLPWAAYKIAFALPYSVEVNLGQEVMAQIDKGPFRPSRLAPVRQRALTEKFRRVVSAEPGRPMTLHFRQSLIGPNAFAMPGGHIVMTDELVNLSTDDDAVIGVLAHEAGHLKHRHTLRKMIQLTITGAFGAWLMGDVSNVAAGALPIVMGAKYSRDLEREADVEALAVLRAHNISTEPLIDLFLSMDSARVDRSKGAPAASRVSDYMSSHPATSERVRVLRER